MPSSWLSSGLIAKLKAEWNIAEQAGETDAAAIVQLNDTAGVGPYHGTQGTAGNRAIYRANRLNGLGSAEYVSSDTYSATISSSTLNESYIAVVRLDTYSGFPSILGSTTSGREWRFTSTGQLAFVQQGLANIGNSVGTILLNVPSIVFSTLKNGSQVYAINGSRETGSAAAALTAGGTTRIAQGGAFMDGDISYLAILSELTQSEQEEYEGLLADLFGIPLVLGHAQRRATRFYLPSTGSAAVSPTPDAAWEENPSLDRFPMPMTRGSSALATIDAAESASAVTDRDLIIAQYVSEELEAGSFGGVIKMQARGMESNAAANYRTQLMVRIMDSAGTTEVGELYSGDLALLSGNPASELATTLTNRRWPRGAGWRGGKLTWNDGDRLVVEVGVREHNAVATIYTASLRVGENNATPMPDNETAATDTHPWIDFGFDFNVYTPPAGGYVYRSRVGSIG